MSKKETNTSDIGDNIKVAVKIIIVIIVIFLLGSIGIGIGFGRGGSGDGSSEQTSTTDDNDSDKESKTLSDGLPANITVKIVEDKVYFDRQECKDKDELMGLLEKYNIDDRNFFIEKEDAIVEEVQWVNAAFDELRIKVAE